MLEKLFTSKNRVKVLEFFLVQKGSGRLRETSKKLNIPVSFLFKELRNLTGIGLLTKDNEIYRANSKCNISEDLGNIFIKTDYIVYPIEKVLQTEKVKYAFIFGSFAKGDYTSESDVDLMILGSIKLSETYEILKPVESRIKRDINPVVWTVGNLRKEKGSSFVRDIFKKKIIILKGDENELRKIVE